MARTQENTNTKPLFEVRHSPVHGLGVFALQPIPKGTRLIEYVGERISHAEADRRYEDKDPNDNHTFLFIVDRRTVIDAGVNGNEARFFNHSCDPNCESVIENRRVFIETIRDIKPGEELSYDYQIQREPDDPPNVDEIFACRCGSPKCRGTMLWPPKRPAKRKRRAQVAKARSKSRQQAERSARRRSGSSRSQSRTKSAARQRSGSASKRSRTRSTSRRSSAARNSRSRTKSASRRSSGTRSSRPRTKSGRRR